VRWIGNERGVAGETHWSTIRPESVPFPGADGPEVIRALQEGHADGTVWRPGETDVSIRPGWFHHAAEDARVKSVEALVDIYFTSVGRNSKLLLNVPPTRAGVLHATDVARLAGMRAALDTLFARPVRLVPAAWRITGAREASESWALDDAVLWRVVELREGIAEGQRVARWRLRTGDGREVAAGTTIGHRQLRRVPPMTASQLVLEVETVEVPRPVTLRVYEGA
jgi:alpha-L-fucosidase